MVTYPHVLEVSEGDKYFFDNLNIPSEINHSAEMNSFLVERI